MPVVREISRAKTFILLSRDKAEGEAAIAELCDMLKSAQIPYKLLFQLSRSIYSRSARWRTQRNICFSQKDRIVPRRI